MAARLFGSTLLGWCQLTSDCIASNRHFWVEVIPKAQPIFKQQPNSDCAQGPYAGSAQGPYVLPGIGHMQGKCLNL